MSAALARWRPLTPFAAFFLMTETALRLALLLRALPELELSVRALARIFGVGLFFDAVVLAHLLLPAALVLQLAPARWQSGAGPRALAFGGSALGAFAVLTSAAAEWLFWGEFESRFNFIAVDYLVYTRELLANLVESYPLGALFGAIGLAALGVTLGLRAGARGTVPAAPLAARLAAAAGALALPLLCFFRVDSSIAEDAPQRLVGQLASNGLYGFAAAFRRNEISYQDFYAMRAPDAALRDARRLVAEPGARFRSAAPVDLDREVRTDAPEGHPNVVMIVVESLSAELLGAFGDARGLTPNLDQLARESLLFTQLYATGNRTVRGIEALTLSLPPTPGHAIVKRPDHAGLFSLGSLLRARGYRTRFLYGGNAYFDDMADFFSTNGFDVTDRGDLRATFANAWGVADEDLLGAVADQADRDAATGAPFFHFVLTTSNHRPFTYPEGRVDLPPGHGRAGAVKYTDWAIGSFLRAARTRPWFANTVFVIVADHCAGTSGRVDIALEHFHIPLLFWAPGRIAPRRVTTLASQIDVAPTLLALLGFDYRSKFFGRDILAMRPEEGRALPATYERLGLWRGKSLVVLGPRREIRWERVAPDGASQLAAEPADGGALRDDAIALYESAALLHARARDRWEPEPLELAHAP